MYQRSSRRLLTILVGLSLGLNVILAIGYVQLQGNLDAANRQMERLEATKADSQDLTQWKNRVLGCLNVIANQRERAGAVERACGNL